MMMSIIAIVIVAVIAYLQAIRGFFSSMINLICVIAAGAVAFGLWETVAYALLERAPTSGFLSFISSNAWGIALAGTFGVSLAILRVVFDSIVRANAEAPAVPQFVGGLICGVGAGVISAGIFVQSAMMLRISPSFMGYERLVVGDGSVGGSIQRNKKLILPVDDLTAALYGSLSEGTFASATSLAAYQPDLADMHGGLRMSESGGKARNTLAPDDFSLASWYTVGKGANVAPNDLLTDAWNDIPQRVHTLTGEPAKPGDYIAGFAVKFNAGAREKSGQIVMGPGQVRLVVERGSEREAIFPIAVVSQSEAASQEAARFRFDAPFHVASVGGGSSPTMAFEFLVPSGFEPKSLYVRNIRANLSAQPNEFPAVAARDGAISGGSITGSAAATGTLDNSAAQSVETQGERGGPNSESGIMVSNNVGRTVQKGTHTPLELNDNNQIVNGFKRFDASAFSGNRALERALRIDKFAVTPDTVMVQVDVSASSKSSILGRAVAAAEALGAPALIDSNGTRYEAVGYIYRDRDFLEIKYTPGEPVRAITQLPPLSRSRPDQQLTLLFRPSLGVEITSFAVGNRVVTEYSPGISLDNPQR